MPPNFLIENDHQLAVRHQIDFSAGELCFWNYNARITPVVAESQRVWVCRTLEVALAHIREWGDFPVPRARQIVGRKAPVVSVSIQPKGYRDLMQIVQALRVQGAASTLH